LAAKKLRCTEEQVQAMKDRGDSLDKVELVMTIEEILQDLKR
jgi:acyl carrier protein